MRSVRLVLLLALLFVTACAAPPAPPPSPPGLDWSPVGTEASFTLDLEREGEAVLSLTGATRGVAWGTAGAESVVLTWTIDDKRVRHQVWTEGAPELATVGVGHLAAGAHSIKLSLDPGLNRSSTAELRIDALSLAPAPDQELARYAPVLIGRDDSHYTDLPAFLFARRLPDGTLTYQVAYTNEDGGTGVNPRLQVARWGRLADLEWALEVTRDPQGTVTGRSFQGALHLGLPFNGPLEGDKALLRVATMNGVFADDGKPGAFKLSPPVFEFTPQPWQPREAVMDQHPWLHRLMEQEAIREGKLDPACSDAAKVWALDCHAYVDVSVSSSSPLGERRLWGLELRTTEGGTYRSEGDLGAEARSNRTGEVRLAIPHPRGERVAELHAYFVDDGGDAVSITLGELRLWRWDGAQMVNAGTAAEPVTLDRTTPEALLLR